ncbi:MAG: tetratricopeptide repeat protein [Deltaproteobacteria bacterium]|nr:tetratricopeptide repeat protein [Deltaproteobacteria bacterium]
MKRLILSTVTLAFLAVSYGPAHAQTSEGPPAEAASPAPKKAQTEAKKEDDGKLKGGKYTLDKFERGSMDSAVAAKLQQISRIRKQQIAKLESLLKNPYYENKAEVYFRLAEANWQEGLYEYLQKRKEYDKAMDAYNQGTLSTKPVEPVEDYSVSLEYYRKVLREFPNYARIDEVIYYLGKGALKEGKNKGDRNLAREGAEYLKRLVQNYPKSRFIAKAHLAMGEYYFENNSLYYAKINYEKIINNFPKSSMYNYALYKLGWVYFNLNEFEKTIKTFQKVVEQVSKVKAKGIVEFRQQALNDLVVTYAEVDDGWKRARDYFLTVMSEKDTYKKLRALGDLYIAQDKDSEAIGLFRHFMEREKTSKNIVEYFSIILQIYKKVNDVPALDRVTMEALDYFKENGTWRTVNLAKNPEAVKEADKLTHGYLYWLANHYHREAQRLNSAEYYKKAADKYAVYLSRFGNWKKAYVVNFYYAEILYDRLKDYAAAKEQYQKVIERDKKGEFVEDAALGVIYCVEQLMVAKGLRKRAKKGRKIEVVKVDPKKRDAPIPETDLAPLEVEYVAASDKYVDLLKDLIKDPKFPKKFPERGKKIPEIMYISSRVFYKHGKFRDAVKRLKILFNYDPSSKFAAYGVFTLLDAYQRLKQWPKVEKWARKLIKAKNFKVRSKRDLQKIVAIAMTENARLLSKERKYGDAITEAMRVYREFRKEKKTASKALFNVAALYEGQKNVEMAVKTYNRVVREFPKQDVAPEAMYTIGLIYESQTQFVKAAKSFQRLQKFPKYKHAPDAIQNAGLIREALGEFDGAIVAYKKFLKLFPKNADVPKIDMRIGRLYEMKGGKKSLKKAYDHYRKWLRKKYKVNGAFAVEATVRAAADLKNIDKKRNRRTCSKMFGSAIKLFNKIVESGDAKVIKKAKKFAAQAAFELADYLYDDFALLKIPSTLKPRVLKKALQAKAEAQQKAEKAFDAVLDYKSGGWSAGALYKIGLLYYEFARDLYDVPVPEDLPPEVEIEYTAILDEISRPVFEKSRRAFERALDLAHEKKVYNKYSKACGEYAVKVNPDAFPVAGDDQVKTNHTKDTLASTSFIRSLRRGEIEVQMIEEAGK